VPPTTFVSSIESIGEWGWLWHIPQREATSVGLVLPQEKMQALKTSDEALEQFFLRQCRALPHLGRLLEDASWVEGSFHVIRDYSYRSSAVAGPGFYLLGDAAGFVDPIFSVGVLFAMFTGYLAGWAIDRSLRQPGTAERNRRIYATQLDGRMEVARALALPQYGAIDAASDAARRTVHFESRMEQELMFVVSTLTTRNENVLDMVQGRDGDRIASDRYRVLDEITF
jgi:flavin-dependent dehydrogenase